MRILITIVFIAVSFFTFGQTSEAIKSKIDKEVAHIEIVCKQTTSTFSIQALKKVLHYIRYTYSKASTGDMKITRQFSHKKDTIIQSFYLKNGVLIYATETITSFNVSNGVSDSVLWAGQFYFSKGKLIDYYTLGHGKSELESWVPGQGILIAFREAKRDIIRHKNKRNGG